MDTRPLSGQWLSIPSLPRPSNNIRKVSPNVCNSPCRCHGLAPKPQGPSWWFFHWCFPWSPHGIFLPHWHMWSHSVCGFIWRSLPKCWYRSLEMLQSSFLLWLLSQRASFHVIQYPAEAMCLAMECLASRSQKSPPDTVLFCGRECKR